MEGTPIKHVQRSRGEIAVADIPPTFPVREQREAASEAGSVEAGRFAGIS
jgi:hypothetical protein